MTTFCQCCYETASLAGAEGPMRGVLLCAACERPKRRALPEVPMAYPDAARALDIPESMLRALVSAGSIVPSIRRGSFVRIIPTHASTQLSQKGINKRNTP